jgi:uncharacterized YigZ family protein
LTLLCSAQDALPKDAQDACTPEPLREEKLNYAVRYPIPADIQRVETVVVNSRFIATAALASTVAEAQDFIARIRAEFADATHNVYAYRVGYGSSVIDSCSDDGEPPGTAGRPVLVVVQNSGLGDIVLVVTRYFGGTKLGTGGLVRAYSGAAQAVLAALPRTERIEKRTFDLTVPYKFYDTLTRLVAAHDGQIDNAQFAADIAVRLTFPVDRLEEFCAALRQASAGKLEVQDLS